MAGLEEQILYSLVADLADSNTIAIVLGGSHARGETTAWSDVDFLQLVKDSPSGSKKTYQFTSGHLMSIATRTLTWYQTMLTRPEQAIFIVPALREARSLFDPQGQFHNFQQMLQAFDWTPLQPAANQFASQTVVNCAEAVLKLLSARVRKDHFTAFGTAMTLFFDLTLAVAVQRGCFIEGNRPYLAQVEEAVASDSAWSTIHREFVDLNSDSGLDTLTKLRTRLACKLYGETVRLLRSALAIEHLAVAEQTILLVNMSGVL
jgi:hypothetical protein